MPTFEILIGNMTSGTTIHTQSDWVAGDALVDPDGNHIVVAESINGKVVADIADNAVSGGNARGVNAVDLQTARTAATQVAAGPTSTIGGGQNNSASASNSTIGGGTSNAAAGVGATVAGGNGNAASGVNSWVAGGASAVADKNGEGAFGITKMAVDGDSQGGFALFAGQTAGNTIAELFMDSVVANSRFVIATNTCYLMTMKIIGVTLATAKHASLERQFMITRGATGAPVISAITTIGIDKGSNAGGVPAVWSIGIGADAVNNSLKITVNGDTGDTVRWVSRLDYVKTIYA